MFKALPVTASVRVMVTAALKAVSVMLLTLTVNSMRSPSRRKRGDAGSTIISLRVVRVVSILPVLSESVYDIPFMFHMVSSCGARNRTVAIPSSSVSRYSNRPVVLRSERKAIFSCSRAASCNSMCDSAIKSPELNTTSSPATPP